MDKKKNKERRYRLSDDVARALGLQVKPDYKRYRLSKEQEKNYLKSIGKEEKDDCDLDNVTVTETNQYQANKGLSALKDNGQIMSIEEYCEHYGIESSHVKSYKLVSHTGVPYYNIASHSLGEDEVGFPIEEIKSLIEEDLRKLSLVDRSYPNFIGTPIVASLADLHFGAYVDNLVKTRTFSIDILVSMLEEAAERINKHQSAEVHVHLLGDLIESFTGLNHINSWKGLQKGMIGAEVVKLCVQVLHTNFLSKIKNLATVKTISGNHDRVTANKTEDTDGDAANLIAWGLELIGYDVEYNAFVITHLVNGINYILLHGHDSISKRSTKDICWDYGKQGYFNFITEGHLHSIIEKLSVSQRKSYNTIKDDAIDHRRMNCPSLFTGNSYSERLGYTSNSGFIISENNGKGVPNVYFYAL